MGMLEGQVALITGGSKGLGAATARLFAEAGARVVITFGGDNATADRLIAELPGAGHRASRTPAQDTAAIENLVATIGAGEGRLDILINNAGSTRVIPHADLRALDDEFFDFVLAVNLRGAFATVRACQPLLKASGHGLVVNVGSVSGVRGGGSNIAYAAAKAGLHAMTMSLARALAPEIRVVAVAPSLMETPMTRMWTPAQRAQRIASNPLKRIARPDEVAAVMLGLATTMTFVNGAIIPVDGGSLL
ncbi:MAG: SDR family oxidoreductase [Alphaproteobacteria bacterium]|nr:SDR family oxidoreductase [Alphaproteobacteria bacterium]